MFRFGSIELGSACVVLALATCAGSARAQDAPPAPAPPSADAAADKLVDELLASEGLTPDDDLRWLYSDVEEYAPSDLVGEPIPAPGLPQRGEGAPRTWNPRWRRFGTINYVITGAALGIAAGSAFIPEPSTPWTSRNSIDEGVRDAIGIHNYERGQWGRDVSDVLLSTSIAYPLLVDSLVVTYWYRGSHSVAGQMALITAETLAVTAAIHGLIAGFAGRERPYGRNCGTSIDESLDDCERDRRFRSFFSGHTSLSFAAAGVACSHHARHEVFGDDLADALACGAAFLAAGVTGAMRIVGDQHYASDVAMGATIGTLSGLGVPWLLHYGPLVEVESEDNQPQAVRFSVVPVPNGVGVGGSF